ncbi:MAG: hypothetical protein EOP48_12310 [Sphingobacteriales bacterium]|nr:MAG: hypothetical protein EOP48_12310 [Sphingobacteriales bacterium]
MNSLAGLRNFRAGTGTHWQDTQVLIKNDMRFVTSWDYEPLFKMLGAKRFDYIIRGAQEIWSELALHPDIDLAAEQQLLLRYQQPVYFFVRPGNTELAMRILEGLELAEKDGSLETLIISVPGFQKAREEIRNKDRRIIDLIPG